MKMFEFDKGWDWQYEKGIPTFLRKVIGKELG